MESHKRVLGILFIVSGVLRVLGMVFFMTFFAAILPLLLQEASTDEAWIIEWIGRSINLLGWIFVLFFAVPRIIAGIGLVNNKSWAPIMALIWGCLGVFVFPLGTALCAYTIWVYLEDNKAKRAAA